LLSSGGISGSEALWRMLASMVVIIVLGLLCYVMVKRVMPRIARPGGRTVRVLETACLERGQRVHVLSVGTEKYLVASGRSGVTVLANVTQALGGDNRPAERTSGGDTKST
jgi:flagellar biogenesis protein FliO